MLTVVVPAAAATNLIANGTFEGSGAGSLKGWGASSGTLSLTTGAGGGHAAQLTASSGAAQTYAYTSTRPVTSTVAGTAYQLDAQVESGLAGQTVCLQLRELKGTSTTLVGSAQSCISPTATWASFPTVAYTVQGSGNSLTVQIKEKPAVAGATYAMDNVSLSAGAAAPDTEPPSVPQGVTATALGPTAVTVAWSPSSDNVGVTGYDVLRGGTRVATVGGSATSWTDTTVQPSTGYTYTVDAFDAAGNHSVESAPAGVTTPASSGGTGAPIVMIMMENKPASAIVGSPYAPYIQSMIHSGTLLSNVLGVAGGVVDTTAYTQPSLLAGLELRFGFPRLNAAATATPAPIP